MNLIRMYGPIGEIYQNGISANKIIDSITKASGKRITLHINSPGGVVDQGISIYNALKRHQGGVTVIVDALAASIASVIAMAGDKRLTAKGGRWMIHRAHGNFEGNQNDLRKAIEVLDVHDRSITDIYVAALKRPRSEVEAMLDAETWFTADDAVKAGLATGIENMVAVRPIAAHWFKNAPAAIAGEPDGARLRLIKAKARLLAM